MTMQGAVSGSRHCPYCKQDKVRLFSGQRLKDGSKIYIDGQKARWAGRRCPDCERSRVQAAVRCDSFDKDIIAKVLEEQGYTLASKNLPLLAEKDGTKQKIIIRRAFADGSKVVIENQVEPSADLVALVFESVRIIPREQLHRLGENLVIYGQDPSALTASKTVSPRDEAEGS